MAGDSGTESRGFSGLSDLASDVSIEDDFSSKPPAPPPEPPKSPPAPIESSKPPEPPKLTPAPAENGKPKQPASDSFRTIESLGTRKGGSTSRGLWVFGIIFVVIAILASLDSEQKPKKKAL